MEADFVPVSEIQQEPNLHATLFSPALDQAAQQACQQLWSNEDIPNELLFGIQLDEEDPKPTVVDYETISRRIHELPLVNSLSSSQVEQLVTTVHEAVGVDYKEFNRVINIIHWLQWQIDDGNTKVLLENLKADERQPGTKIVSISNKLKYSLLETFLQDIQKYKTQIGLLGMHIDWDDAPETLKD